MLWLGAAETDCLETLLFAMSLFGLSLPQSAAIDCWLLSGGLSSLFGRIFTKDKLTTIRFYFAALSTFAAVYLRILRRDYDATDTREPIQLEDDTTFLADYLPTLGAIMTQHVNRGTNTSGNRQAVST